MKIRTKLILMFSFFVVPFLFLGILINIIYEKEAKNYTLIHAKYYADTFALTIGRDIGNENALPLFFNKEALEDYVKDVHSIQKIDIVIIDTAKTIVADVIKSEIGKKYNYDQNNEVSLTMQDDSDRTFKEVSSDYPHGILLYAHSIKTEYGKTLGVVLIEYTAILKESEANINKGRKIIFYTMLLLIFAAITFGFVISKIITGSISDLVGVARKFAQGDYSVRIKKKRKDELGELGKAFNQMIEQKQNSDEQILFLGNALKNTNDMVAIADINFNIIYVNAAFCKSYEYTEEEVLGKNVSMFRSEKNTIELNKIVNSKTFSTGWFGEQWSKTKNGKEFLIELHISPAKNLKDEVIATIAIFNDITERKATEAILKHSSDQLKLLNEIGRKISSTLELDLILDLTAKQVHERLGYDHVGLFIYDTKENQLEIKSVAGVFSFVFKKGAKFSMEKGMVAQSILTGKMELANDVTNNKYYVNNYPEIINSRSELAIPLKSGDKIIGVMDIQCKRLNAFDKNDVDVLETLGDQIALAINNSLLFESIQQELREKIKAEVSLKESEEKYRLVFSNVPLGIAHYNSNGIVTDCNDIFLEIFGITKEVAIGFNIMQIEDINYKAAYELANTGVVGNYEGDYKPVVSNKIISLKVSFAPIMHGDSKVLGVVGIFEDISERKQTERFFFYDILNTAGNLRNISEIINDESLDNDDKDSLTKKLSTISNQIIEEIVSHRAILSSDKTELKLNIAALNTLEFIKTLIFNFKQLADQENKQITISDKFEDLEINTDRALLTRIISNLIKNAIEASQTGGIITAGCSNEDGQIKLWVHNQTVIPEEIKLKIFHRSFSTKGGGRGIGTYSIKFLTENYLKGKAFFISNEKEGTTFYVSIPS